MPYMDIISSLQDLGISDFASSGLSGHKLASTASSNLCNFFCINKLNRTRR